MEKIYLRDLSSLTLLRIADRIALHPHDWPTVGFYFKSSRNIVIKRTFLESKYGLNNNDQFLCRRLLEELAERDVTIEELQNALQLMGLDATARECDNLA